MVLFESYIKVLHEKELFDDHERTNNHTDCHAKLKHDKGAPE